MPTAPRTPEGEPQRCLVCGAARAAATSDPVCPRCAGLAGRLSEQSPSFPERFTAADLQRPLGEFVDSMEFVELMVVWEDRYPDLAALATANQIRTIADVLRWLRDHGGEDGGAGGH